MWSCFLCWKIALHVYSGYVVAYTDHMPLGKLRRKLNKHPGCSYTGSSYTIRGTLDSDIPLNKVQKSLKSK